METICPSETSVIFLWTTWHYIPKDINIHSHRRENLKSNKNNLWFYTVHLQCDCLWNEFLSPVNENSVLICCVTQCIWKICVHRRVLLPTFSSLLSFFWKKKSNSRLMNSPCVSVPQWLSPSFLNFRTPVPIFMKLVCTPCYLTS
jgi:hypothetical protein